MDPARWERLHELFAAAAARDGDEREAFLAALPAGDADADADLVDQLRRLLAADADAVDRLVDTWHGAAAPARDLVGERLGPYRIAAELGAGGMAVVYRAERDDGQFEQTVAIKVVRPGAGFGADLVRRLREERRLQARLNHPAVVRLFDGGALPDGTPYLVMEHVDGRPLDEHCDRAGLDVDARIDLLLEVCDAVEHAHRNLIVHRDLKPSNILVTAEGRPRLLDFGIAKALAGGEDDLEGTLPHDLRVSPGYCAPEQLRGGAVTTATDVYALGAVLYELLTGRRAHDLGDTTPLGLERAVCGRDVPAASSAAADAVRARRLRGDLDVILAKALQKDAARRYPSVAELAADLRRHRTGQAVLARPASVRYRLGRFVRRHRTGVAAAALVAAALLAGVGGTLWQAREARLQARAAEAERDLARQAAVRAETVTDFLVDLFQAADPLHTGGDTLTVFDLLDVGRERVDGQLADDPGARAALLLAMGDAAVSLGRYDQGDSLLARSLASAGELPQPDPLFTAEVWTSRALLAGLTGDHAAALRHHRAALAVRRDQLGADSQSSAASLTSVGVELMYLGHPDSALTVLREADAMRRRLPAGHELERAGGISSLASATQQLGDLAGADSLFAVAADLLRAHAPANHPTLANLLNNWGILAYQRQRYDDAAAHLAEALRCYEAALGPDHPHTANARGNLAAVRDAQQR